LSAKARSGLLHGQVTPEIACPKWAGCKDVTFLNQHAPEGLPTRAALVAELRRDAAGLSVVK
jgi:hypothetical protein